MNREREKTGLKEEIKAAAWELFYEKGYEETTINDIIKKANTSKGGFYYYFKAKDELLHSLYSFFDREYEKFYENMDKGLDSLVQLKQLSQYVSYFIEGNVSAELLAALYQSQLVKKKQDCFLNPDRYYNRLVRKIIEEGQEKGEIRRDMAVEELAHHVLLLERGIIMDWCVQNGGFSLGYYGTRNFDLYIEFMRPDR
ncbi:TetR family transcriptional regulator [Lachnospiraceae bacterium]|uniref:TetR/AcrR family transcriptional regulator n=1 Tax=Extibacter sp. GGCC_0201 TaxID=2731209 RepID=UPI001AA0B6BE|nr:TetR/AcrR family transcriptional regulator [Extibacter sp. GGCC_0201]MBO1720934.1 TetR/AcrR family transcriptional regulator [Extibacter sp. GGCC_0201]BDF32006.1 TetR family transcriptional regulator [Lachnospiraceae bacterium]BDF36019.1 TetR family transcriptional regulator [Lachnospiraceae bacterium]